MQAVLEDYTTAPISEQERALFALITKVNANSTSIGQADLYPFVLSPTVVGKLDFVHRMVAAHAHP